MKVTNSILSAASSVRPYKRELERAKNNELIDASRNGDQERVEDLLGEEGITDYCKEIALNQAVFQGNFPIVQILFKNGAKPGMSALVIAAKYGHVELVRYFLDNSFLDISSRKLALHAAVENGHLEIVQILAKITPSSDSDRALIPGKGQLKSFQMPKEDCCCTVQ